MMTTEELNNIRMKLYDADQCYENALSALHILFKNESRGGLPFDEFIHREIPALCELRDHLDALSIQFINALEDVKKNKNVP